MKKTFHNPKIPQFLRNWSESIRAIALDSYLDSKQPIFLSTFISNAEKVRKIAYFYDVAHKFPRETYQRATDYKSYSHLFQIIYNNPTGVK